MKVYDSADLGAQVRQRRKELGLTQQQLAQISGNGTRFISDLENGKPTMQVGKVIETLLILGLDLSITKREASL